MNENTAALAAIPQERTVTDEQLSVFAEWVWGAEWRTYINLNALHIFASHVQVATPPRAPADEPANERVARAALRDAAPAGDPASALSALKAAMQTDRSYAWSWQCNLAMAVHDEGVSHRTSNQGAARFMSMCFDVDVTEFPAYVALERQWQALAAPAGEPVAVWLQKPAHWTPLPNVNAAVLRAPSPVAAPAGEQPASIIECINRFGQSMYEMGASDVTGYDPDATKATAEARAALLRALAALAGEPTPERVNP